MVRLQWTVLWSLWAARFVPQPTEQLRIRSGLLRGTVAPDGSHMRYVGIPYATVRERFQEAEPDPTWDPNGVLNAYNEHIRCFQRFTSTRLSGYEDCLTINVYTPMKKDNRLRPVMFYIHGGGFRDGSGSPFLYGPDHFIKHDVILVTFNYRLEILGFLCLGIKEAPGNIGLKDQVEALKWVRKNIEAFGGDPQSVTIFGESAGSASVLYHLVSPMSKGLFQKAIMQSGSAISPWSMQFEPLKTASLLAQQMGYNAKHPKELYEFLSKQPSDKLLSTRVPRAEGDTVLAENIFVPCVETKIPGVSQFLPDTPYNLIRTGQYNKVPVIIGFNSAEGYMFVGKENDTTIEKLTFYGSLPRDLLIPTEDEKVQTAKELKEMYMGEEGISKETLWKFSKYVGESHIVYPAVATTDILSKTMNSPVFAYKFGYDGMLNLPKFLFGYRKYPGATHADELFYMFKIQINLPMTNTDRTMIDRMSTMWTNFVKLGDPTPDTTQLIPIKWRPVKKKDPHILVIDNEFSTEPLWNDKTLLYWNKIYTKYRRKS
ncbi:esterase FE4-like [Epargyreus clarus]|uniref:esterase FE4-like n=1 Tax=Epargyreus clarus TaxID=520877 RepID=UPI003C2BA756